MLMVLHMQTVDTSGTSAHIEARTLLPVLRIAISQQQQFYLYYRPKSDPTSLQCGSY